MRWQQQLGAAVTVAAVDGVPEPGGELLAVLLAAGIFTRRGGGRTLARCG